MKARKLKLGINMDNGWMYCAYRSRGQWPISHRAMVFTFMYLHVFVSNENTFLGNYESQKAETWYKPGQWMAV